MYNQPLVEMHDPLDFQTFLFRLSLGQMENDFWQVHWLELVGVNLYAKANYNFPNGWRVMAVFTNRLQKGDLGFASINKNGIWQYLWLDVVNINEYIFLRN